MPNKVCKLIGKDGKLYEGFEKGTLGGNRQLKIYGRLDCPNALRWLAKGHYKKQRVFFMDETTAIAAGYRPCGICMKQAYQAWKRRKKVQTEVAPLSVNPTNIVWQELYEDGTKYSLLEGTKDVPGTAFTYAFFVPAGFWDAPHFHTATARLAVISGKLRLGYGDSFDKNRTEEFEVGNYLIVPANTVHYDGAEEDTIIIGTAVAPWATGYVK
jgi:quercetin dioxygenase-like cupin family protein